MPRADDSLAVQPHPVEPAIKQDARGHAVHGLHRARVPVLRPRARHGLQDANRHGCAEGHANRRRQEGLPRAHCRGQERRTQVGRRRHLRGLNPYTESYNHVSSSNPRHLASRPCGRRSRRARRHHRRCRHQRLDASGAVPRLRAHPQGQGSAGRAGRDATGLRHLRRFAPDLCRLGARHGLADRGAAQRHPGTQPGPDRRKPAEPAALLLWPVRNRPHEQELSQEQVLRRSGEAILGVHRHLVRAGRDDLGQAGRDLRAARRPVAAFELHGAGRRDVCADTDRHHARLVPARILQEELARKPLARLLARALRADQVL
mmetsp:Transcript_18206/g.43602  ORF Transcript_18206/g.43602 Transcript_18206/m.43602 type:complete len:318 (+) Transcript_18206:1334-2287(+)